MAYTNGAGMAATAAAILAAVPTAQADAINNSLSGLALGTPTPVGTPVMLYGVVLVKCTTGWGNVPGGTNPVFSYDATAIT
jgi:hypothetical protein